jgi:hypothetical protein
MNLKVNGIGVLGWPLTGVVVTLSNERVGTVHVRMLAFYSYREQCRNRGDIEPTKLRTTIIRDLITDFSYATSTGDRRDKFDNLILIGHGLVYIVDEKQKLVLAVFAG